MNIFFLHFVPLICAQMHVDKHVVKMILETTQLLCSAHHMCGNNYTPTYVPPYKLTHKNHPCAKWTRESIDNYKWLCELGIELCNEYTYRYGKVHKCQPYIQDLAKHIPNIPDIGFTLPAQAMPVEHKDENPVAAYRSYYFFNKSNLLSWKGKIAGRDPPEWITEMKSLFEDNE